MKRKSKAALGSVLGLCGALAIPIANGQQPSGPTKAVHVIGIAGVKDNAKGTLKVENGQLRFVRDKKNSDISANSVQDVVTGADTQKAVGKTIGMISMAAPYGGGRFLSLFRKKIDTLTVQYRDADGSLHGAIFTMAVGTAEEIKKQLVAQGAHTSVPDDPSAAQAPTANSSSKEQKQ
jgi:hypothetical protein